MKPAATQKTLRNKKKWDSVKLFLYVVNSAFEFAEVCRNISAYR